MSAAVRYVAGMCWCWTCLVQFPHLWVGVREVHMRFSAVPVAGTLPKGEVFLPDLTFPGLFNHTGTTHECGNGRMWLWLL